MVINIENKLEKQDVFYTVIGDDGKVTEHMVILPKLIDLEGLQSAVRREILANPNLNGKSKVHIKDLESIIGGM